MSSPELHLAGPPPSAAAPPPSPLGWLADARRSLGRYLLWSSCGLALLGGGLTLLAVALAAGGQVLAQVASRLGAALVVAVAGALLVAFGRWPSRLGRWQRRGLGGALGSDRALARWVGGWLPEVASDLLSTVELTESGVGDAGLAGALARSVGERLAHVQPLALVEAAPSRLRALGRRPGAILGALLLLFGAASLMAPSRVKVGLVRVLLVRPPPPTEQRWPESLVADLTVTFRYPAYLKRAPETVANTTGALVAPIGTKVQLRARPQLAARRVELRRYDGQGRPVGSALELRRDGRFVVGELTLNASGGYRFALERATLLGGVVLVEETARPIDAVADRLPEVELVAPADEVELVEGQPVELAWRAKDDQGLRRVALVWQAAGSKGGERKPLELGGVEPRTAGGRFMWQTDALAALAKKGGGRIAYHVEAVDNVPAGGGQVGVSRTLYLRLKDGESAAQEQSRVASARELLDLALDHLADRLEAKGAPLAETAERLHRGGEALLDRLLPWLEELTKGGQSGPKKLREAAIALERLLRLERGAALQTGRVAPPLEQVVLGLDRWLDRRHGREILSSVAGVKETQARLRELFDQLRRAQSDEERRRIKEELQSKMAELEQRLAALTAAMRAREQERGGRSQEEFVNGDALERLDPRNVLSQLRERMERGELDGAAERLAQLERQLAQLEQQLSGGADGDGDSDSGGEGSPETDRAVAELLDEAHALQQQEQALAKETESLAERPAGDSGKGGRDAQRRSAEQAQRQAELEQRAAEMMQGGRTGAPGENGDGGGAKSAVEEAAREAAREAVRRELLRAGSPAERALARARAAMGQAKAQLGQGQPSAARPAQGQAVDALGKLGQELRNAAQQSAQSRGESGSQRGQRSEPIRIPGADQYRPPRALREEILRAMKEAPPEPFRDQVQRYYRELVK